MIHFYVSALKFCLCFVILNDGGIERLQAGCSSGLLFSLQFFRKVMLIRLLLKIYKLVDIGIRKCCIVIPPPMYMLTMMFHFKKVLSTHIHI